MKVFLATPMNGKPIEEIKQKISDCASILAKSAKHIEECEGVLFIGSKNELKQSSGCQVEILIAVSYGKDCFIYENGEVSRLVELELIWSFGKDKERLP